MTAPAAALLNRARSRREAYRTARILPKAVCGPDDGSDAGNWLPAEDNPHVLTRTEHGLSDRPAENNRRQKP